MRPANHKECTHRCRSCDFWGRGWCVSPRPGCAVGGSKSWWRWTHWGELWRPLHVAVALHPGSSGRLRVSVPRSDWRRWCRWKAWLNNRHLLLRGRLLRGLCGFCCLCCEGPCVICFGVVVGIHGAGCSLHASLCNQAWAGCRARRAAQKLGYWAGCLCGSGGCCGLSLASQRRELP